MKVSASFLSIKDNFKYNVLKLCETNIDYLHLDIMDGKFVNNKTWKVDDLFFLKEVKKPLDIHLMVDNIYDYIDEFIKLNPKYITFHYEATTDPYLVIDYIKKYNVKVGISIKPETSIEVLKPFLNLIDLVLVMSVDPGEGGQLFIESSLDKVNLLKQINDESKYHYIVSIDGGINDLNIGKIKADMVVVGSFITKGNYQEQINKLKY